MTSPLDYKPDVCPNCKKRAFRLSKRYGWVCETPDCGYCTNPDDDDALIDDDAPLACEEESVICELCDEEYSKSEVEINEDGTWGCPNCGNFNHVSD